MRTFERGRPSASSTWSTPSRNSVPCGGMTSG
jgi:hypothetical protein